MLWFRGKSEALCRPAVCMQEIGRGTRTGTRRLEPASRPTKKCDLISFIRPPPSQKSQAL